MNGYFITFEGGEGAGKSTQIKLLACALQDAGHDVVITREPGGTAGAEAVRHVVLSGKVEKYGPSMEAILFAAARADHIDQFIVPALNAHKIVLCDRFIDSTRVYQGQNSKLSDDFLPLLEKVAIGNHSPDLTLILDVPAAIGMARANERREKTEAVDRFEKDALEIQEQRRQAFLRIADVEYKRCKVIDATRSPEVIADEIKTVVMSAIAEKLND